MMSVEERTRQNRWNARGMARVVHPVRGTVVVPHHSNLGALLNAAEVWGCKLSDLEDARVWAAEQEDGPVCRMPAYNDTSAHWLVRGDAEDVQAPKVVETGTSICRYCHARIAWIRMPSGRPMPVETRTTTIRTDRGRDTFVTMDGRTVRGERVLARAAVAGLKTAYVPHWAFCR